MNFLVLIKVFEMQTHQAPYSYKKIINGIKDLKIGDIIRIILINIDLEKHDLQYYIVISPLCAFKVENRVFYRGFGCIAYNVSSAIKTISIDEEVHLLNKDLKILRLVANNKLYIINGDVGDIDKCYDIIWVSTGGRIVGVNDVFKPVWIPKLTNGYIADLTFICNL
jgi:hypothetical protein